MNNNMKATIKILMIAATLAFFAACGEKDTDREPTATENNNDSSGDTIPAGWIDLGLPSGLLWAECNLGANAPEEYGDYYAWGETSPKSVCSWQT